MRISQRWRSYLLGLAGGICFSSVIGSIPLWLLVSAIAIVTWFFADLVTSLIFKEDTE